MPSPSTSPPGPRVVIVGAGLVGTSSAWLLARAGARVTVLERAVPGAEASSAAAGILGAEIECDAPGPLLELCRKSLELYPTWIRELEVESGVDVEFDTGGTLLVEREPSRFAAQLERRAFQLAEGRVTTREGDALRELEPALGPSFTQGLHFGPDARVAPRQLLDATHRAAERAGARFVSGLEVERIVSEGDAEGRRVRGVALRDGGWFDADVVVVAAGSWSSQIAGLPLSPGAVRPARGQLVELRLDQPRLARVVFGSGVYLVPRRDGTVLLGATLEFVGHRRGTTAAGVAQLLRGALEVMPALAEAEFVATWSNFRPYSDDHLPLLGPTDVRGLVLASGHYRNGILLAPVTARAVESLVLGLPPPLPLEPYDPRRLAPERPAATSPSPSADDENPSAAAEK